MKKNNVRVEQLGYNWLKLSSYTIGNLSDQKFVFMNYLKK
jgi:hypothetical protein